MSERARLIRKKRSVPLLMRLPLKRTRTAMMLPKRAAAAVRP